VPDIFPQIAATVHAEAKYLITRRKWCATAMPLVEHLTPKGIASVQAEQFAQPTAAFRIALTLAALVVEQGSTSCTHAVPVLANAIELGLGPFSRSRYCLVLFSESSLFSFCVGTPRETCSAVVDVITLSSVSYCQHDHGLRTERSQCSLGKTHHPLYRPRCCSYRLRDPSACQDLMCGHFGDTPWATSSLHS